MGFLLMEGVMTRRGSYGFEVRSDGRLADNDFNLGLLRKLFRDGAIVQNKFGPGNPGDFNHGSWHILCHLAGGSAVIELAGRKAWIGITHKGFPDVYEAAIVFRGSGSICVRGLKTEAGKAAAAKSEALGLIQGTSPRPRSPRQHPDSPG